MPAMPPTVEGLLTLIPDPVTNPAAAAEGLHADIIALRTAIGALDVDAAGRLTAEVVPTIFPILRRPAMLLLLGPVLRNGPADARSNEELVNIYLRDLAVQAVEVLDTTPVADRPAAEAALQPILTTTRHSLIYDRRKRALYEILLRIRIALEYEGPRFVNRARAVYGSAVGVVGSAAGAVGSAAGAVKRIAGAALAKTSDALEWIRATYNDFGKPPRYGSLLAAVEAIARDRGLNVLEEEDRNTLLSFVSTIRFEPPVAATRIPDGDLLTAYRDSGQIDMTTRLRSTVHALRVRAARVAAADANIAGAADRTIEALAVPSINALAAYFETIITFFDHRRIAVAVQVELAAMNINADYSQGVEPSTGALIPRGCAFLTETAQELAFCIRVLNLARSGTNIARPYGQVSSVLVRALADCGNAIAGAGGAAAAAAAGGAGNAAAAAAPVQEVTAEMITAIGNLMCRNQSRIADLEAVVRPFAVALSRHTADLRRIRTRSRYRAPASLASTVTANAAGLYVANRGDAAAAAIEDAGIDVARVPNYSGMGPRAAAAFVPNARAASLLNRFAEMDPIDPRVAAIADRLVEAGRPAAGGAGGAGGLAFGARGRPAFAMRLLAQAPAVENAAAAGGGAAGVGLLPAAAEVVAGEADAAAALHAFAAHVAAAADEEEEGGAVDEEDSGNNTNSVGSGETAVMPRDEEEDENNAGNGAIARRNGSNLSAGSEGAARRAMKRKTIPGSAAAVAAEAAAEEAAASNRGKKGPANAPAAKRRGNAGGAGGGAAASSSRGAAGRAAGGGGGGGAAAGGGAAGGAASNENGSNNNSVGGARRTRRRQIKTHRRIRGRRAASHRRRRLTRRA